MNHTQTPIIRKDPVEDLCDQMNKEIDAVGLKLFLKCSNMVIQIRMEEMANKLNQLENIIIKQ